MRYLNTFKERVIIKESISSKYDNHSSMTLYHMSCDDFDIFKEDIITYFAKTKKDVEYFNKNWRSCDDKDPILYICKVNLGRVFDPKNLSNDEVTSIGKLVNETINKEDLWGIDFELKEDDYPNSSDLEFSLHILNGPENWHMMEQPVFIEWLNENKYDSFIIDEREFNDDTIGVLNHDNIEVIEKNIFNN